MLSRTRIFLLAALSIAFAAGPAPAQEAKMLSPEAHLNWQAIGRVNIAGLRTRRLCTGTLVAPDVVVTAAHCVFTLSDDTPHPAEDIHFVAGWFRGEHAGHSTVRQVHMLTDWRPGRFQGLAAIGEDLVALELEDPIDDITPLPFASAADGAALRILGYRWDRPHALSDYGDCAARAQTPQVLVLSCTVTYGTSGAPVLQEGPDGWQIVGVTSSIHRRWTLAAALPR